MSEYTTREILDMIEANGGPEGLDLSGKDLTGIDLSRETVRAELQKLQAVHPDAERAWCLPVLSSGVHLVGVNLAGARLTMANLSDARLLSTSLQGVKVTAEQPGQAFWLGCATLPDGTNLSEDNWKAEFE